MNQGCSYKITLVGGLHYFSFFLFLAPGKKGGSKGKGKGVEKNTIFWDHKCLHNTPLLTYWEYNLHHRPPWVKVTPQAQRVHDDIMDTINQMYRGQRLTHMAREKSGIVFCNWSGYYSQNTIKNLIKFCIHVILISIFLTY